MKGGKLANPERLNIYRNSTIFTTSEHEVLTFNYTSRLDGFRLIQIWYGFHAKNVWA